MEVLLCLLAAHLIVKYTVSDAVATARNTEPPRGKERRERAQRRHERAMANGGAPTVAEALAGRIAQRVATPRERAAAGQKEPGPARAYLSELWRDAWQGAGERHRLHGERKQRGDLPRQRVARGARTWWQQRGGLAPDRGRPWAEPVRQSSQRTDRCPHCRQPEGVHCPDCGACELDAACRGGTCVVDDTPTGGDDGDDGHGETAGSAPAGGATCRRCGAPGDVHCPGCGACWPGGACDPGCWADLEEVEVAADINARWHADQAAAAGAQTPEATPEQEQTPAPVASVHPIRPEGTPLMTASTDSTAGAGETVDPEQALAFAQQMAGLADKAAGECETSIAALTEHGVTGGPIAKLTEMQESFAAAADTARGAADYFKAHLDVADAAQAAQQQHGMGGGRYAGIGS